MTLSVRNFSQAKTTGLLQTRRRKLLPELPVKSKRSTCQIQIHKKVCKWNKAITKLLWRALPTLELNNEKFALKQDKVVICTSDENYCIDFWNTFVFWHILSFKTLIWWICVHLNSTQSRALWQSNYTIQKLQLKASSFRIHQ